MCNRYIGYNKKIKYNGLIINTKRFKTQAEHGCLLESGEEIRCSILSFASKSFHDQGP